MKKSISLLLVFTVLFTVFSFAVSAESSHVDCALFFGNAGLDERREMYYIRLDEEAKGISDSFAVDSVWKIYGGEELSIQVPDDWMHIEQGELLEIVLVYKKGQAMMNEEAYLKLCTLKGVIFEDGKEHDVEVTNNMFKQGGNLWDVWTSMNRTGLFGERETDEFYVSTGSKWSLNVSKAKHMTDQYLADHASFSAEGIVMTQEGNTYSFPEVGDGTVTLELAGCIRRTWNLHVMDKKAMKAKMLKDYFLTILFLLVEPLFYPTEIFLMPVRIGVILYYFMTTLFA